MKRPDKFWDLFAGFESKKVLNKELGPSKVFQLIEKYLKDDDIVMDFGCGPGGMAIRMASRVKKVFGIDFSMKTIENAKNRILQKDVTNLIFKQATIFDESFEKESFNVITALYVLHVINEPDKVAERIKELLKPGGVFISATICMGEKAGILTSILRFLSKLGLIPSLNTYKTEELLNLMEKSSLEIIDKVKLANSFSEYFIVAKRK